MQRIVATYPDDTPVALLSVGSRLIAVSFFSSSEDRLKQIHAGMVAERGRLRGVRPLEAVNRQSVESEHLRDMLSRRAYPAVFVRRGGKLLRVELVSPCFGVTNAAGEIDSVFVQFADAQAFALDGAARGLSCVVVGVGCQHGLAALLWVPGCTDYERLTSKIDPEEIAGDDVRAVAASGGVPE